MNSMKKFWALLFLLAVPPPAQALTVSEQSLRIEDSKEGNVLLGADNAVLEKGESYRTILLLWGHLDIYGEVEEVVVLSGHVVFHEGSQLHKSLVVMGGSFESKSGAQVAAENVIVKVPGPAWRLLRSAGNLWRDHFDSVAKIFAGIFSCLFLWLSGWLLFRSFPTLMGVTAGQLSREWPKNLAVGFLGSIASCVVAVMLVISILGIALLPFYVFALVCASWITYLAAALWAGHRFFPPKRGKKLHPGGFLLGILAFYFLWAVPVWWAAIPVLLLWTLAWGALLRSLRLLWR